VAQDAPWLPIGEFASRTRLTRKALRVYDRVGLLRPADIDEATGYRRYSVAQVHAGRLIGLLRGADLGLAEIGLVLDEIDSGPAAALECLESLLARLDRRHADRKVLIRHVQTVLRGADPMFALQTRHVPACRVMSIQRRVRAHETESFVREAKAAFRRHLAGAEPTGPFMMIFHGIVGADSDGPLEVALGCPADVPPTEVIGIRTEPAHDEVYTTITKAQWAYPAILAAYDAVAASPQVRERSGSRLSCREVYLAEPDSVGEDELICDVAFPLGSG
jgi:DNA-binding transcriptional MerR regulator